MAKRRILFLLQEMTPYLPETPAAIKARELTQKFHENGFEIRTFMPRYGLIKERRYQLHEVIRLSGMNIIIDDTDHSLIIKVATVPQTRMQVYFIDSEDYFQRKATFYDEEGKFFEDNDERVIFYSRGILETVKRLRWSPEVIYIQGWLAALVPIYIKKYYIEDPLFANTKIITAITKDQFSETLNNKMKRKAKFGGIPDKEFSTISTPNFVNLMKLALKHSDGAVLEDPQEQINPELLKFLKNNKIKTLDFKAEDFFDEYKNFFNEFLN